MCTQTTQTTQSWFFRPLILKEPSSKSISRPPPQRDVTPHYLSTGLLTLLVSQRSSLSILSCVIIPCSLTLRSWHFFFSTSVLGHFSRSFIYLFIPCGSYRSVSEDCSVLHLNVISERFYSFGPTSESYYGCDPFPDFSPPRVSGTFLSHRNHLDSMAVPWMITLGHYWVVRSSVKH